MSEIQGDLYAPPESDSADPEEREYRNLRHFSFSTLEVFKKSPRRFQALYVTRTMPSEPPTEQMQLGTALHTVLLQPDRWDKLVAVIPEGTERRSNAGKEAWEQFLLANKGKALITVEDRDAVRAMAESILAKPAARRLLEAEGKVEYPLVWTDQATGLRLKGKCDKILPGLIADLKTTGHPPSPNEFGKSCANYGYHRQAAMYRRGYVACAKRKVRPPDFLHIVVHNKPPFESGLFRLRDEDIDFGERQLRKVLERLKYCLEENCWTGHGEEEVAEASLPRWAFYED